MEEPVLSLLHGDAAGKGMTGVARKSDGTFSSVGDALLGSP
jgi:hypothetical protein